LYDALREKITLENPYLFTEWLLVDRADDLKEYARRFIEHYGLKKEDILIGTSLGGVLAIEINKILRVKKIIAISTIKTKHEKPSLFRFLRFTKTYKLFIPQVLKVGLDLVAPLYGRNISSYLWFRSVFKSSDNDFLRWSLAEIVNWQNEEIPGNLIHIHGSRDPLFPLRNSKSVDHTIKGGTHAMVRFRANEIAEIIKQEAQ
jgi:pimeloyl-ACP methyl ester carboxylesterase